MPKPLHFRQPSVAGILKGDKRLTVRRAGTGYQAGDLVKAVRRNQPAFAELRIETVEQVTLPALTARHAQQEGEPDVDALQSSLRRLFPGQDEFEVITFRVV